MHYCNNINRLLVCLKTDQFTRNCSVPVKDACAEYHRSPWLPLTENITVLREPEFLYACSESMSVPSM